ncbi:hypothetical protein, partial [Paenibacillus terrae]
MKYKKEIRNAIEGSLQLYVSTFEKNYTGIAASSHDATRLKLITKEEAVWIPIHEINHLSTVLPLKSHK